MHLIRKSTENQKTDKRYTHSHSHINIHIHTYIYTHIPLGDQVVRSPPPTRSPRSLAHLSITSHLHLHLHRGSYHHLVRSNSPPDRSFGDLLLRSGWRGSLPGKAGVPARGFQASGRVGRVQGDTTGWEDSGGVSWLAGRVRWLWLWSASAAPDPSSRARVFHATESCRWVFARLVARSVGVSLSRAPAIPAKRRTSDSESRRVNAARRFTRVPFHQKV